MWLIYIFYYYFFTPAWLLIAYCLAAAAAVYSRHKRGLCVMLSELAAYSIDETQSQMVKGAHKPGNNTFSVLA